LRKQSCFREPFENEAVFQERDSFKERDSFSGMKQFTAVSHIIKQPRAAASQRLLAENVEIQHLR